MHGTTSHCMYQSAVF